MLDEIFKPKGLFTTIIGDGWESEKLAKKKQEEALLLAAGEATANIFEDNGMKDMEGWLV